MAYTCISTYEADKIASAIASKAFKHLIDAKAKEIQDALAAEYDHFLDHIGGDALVVLREYGFISDNQKTVSFEFADANRQEVSVTLNDAEGRLLGKDGGWGCDFCIKDDELFQQFDTLKDQLNDLHTQELKLREDISIRLRKKSVKKVKMFWPELSAILDEFFGAEKDTDFIVPFEKLLGRHLPALAAPKD